MSKNCEKDLDKEKKCTCQECDCDKECECGCADEKNEYLELAQRIQAEFDNYRKRSSDIVRTARNDGIIDAVTKFLPSLDAIKKAKQMITDEKTLEGIELIDKEFTNSLKALGIEEIETSGQHFNPSLHNVIAVKTDNSLEDGVITDTFQAGYKIGDRVIRYSQVIINKLENKKEI